MNKDQAPRDHKVPNDDQIVDKDRPHRQTLAALMVLAMLVLAIAELYAEYTSWAFAPTLGVISFLLLAICLMRDFSVREWALFLLASILSVSIFYVEGGGQPIMDALRRAAFFAAFIFLVTLLKEAAARSSAVRDLGRYLTEQPKGRRYYTLAGGGHLMGILLNFGAVSLLTPLIQRGARAASNDAKLIALAEQQQISALIRGFAWMIMWSPTALTQVVLFTTFPTINVGLVTVLGIAASVILVIVGRLEDRFRWKASQYQILTTPPVFPKYAAKRFFLVCSLLIALTLAFVATLNKSGAIALMLSAPLIMFMWIFAQTQSDEHVPRVQKTFTSIWNILMGSSSSLARNSFLLGTAAFIGEVGAKLTPVGSLAAMVNLEMMPDWLFLASLPVIITLGGQVALSPILMVVFLGAVINALPSLPADPNLIVFALGAGWAMSMTASPNATATLLISGIAKIPPTVLTWRWNGMYSLICYILFVLSFYLLSQFMTGP